VLSTSLYCSSLAPGKRARLYEDTKDVPFGNLVAFKKEEEAAAAGQCHQLFCIVHVYTMDMMVRGNARCHSSARVPSLDINDPCKQA